jgi:hypothetical protein
MTKTNTLIAGAAVAALTLGVAGEGSLQTPRWDGDIVIVKDGGTPAMGQPDDTPKQSAEMGKADGVQGGKNQGNVPKSRSAMIKGAQSDQGQSE